MQSNVRSIESLTGLRDGIRSLSDELDLAVQEIRGCVEAVQAWAQTERPAYWKHQTVLAERRLTAALEGLSQARSTPDPRARPAASEAQQQVSRAQQRLRLCQSQRVACRRHAAALDAAILRLAGPLALIEQRAQNDLPRARAELGQIIQILHSYSERQPQRPTSGDPTTVPSPNGPSADGSSADESDRQTGASR